MYGRRKPTENDFKFIEQRQTDEVESLHTESTYLSSSESSNYYNNNYNNSLHRGITRVKNGQIKTIIVKPAQDNLLPSAHEYPFTAVLDYQKKLNQVLKDNVKFIYLYVRFKTKGILPPPDVPKPKPEIETAAPRARKQKIEDSPRMEVVYHISRDEISQNM